MRCNDCQDEMVRTKVGYLCANCGNTGHKKPSSVDLIPKTIESRAPKATAKKAKSSKKKHDIEADSTDDVSLEFAEINPSLVTGDMIVPDHDQKTEKAKRSQKYKPENDHSPVAGTSTSVPSQAKVLPLVAPVTYPAASSSTWPAIIVIGIMVMATSMAWLFLAPNSPLVVKSDNAELAKASGATPIVTPVATASPLSTPAASVALAGDFSTRDTQRKTDLVAYASAYRTSSVNGFYPIVPAKVLYVAKDPSTDEKYIIQTAEISALGQIYYRAGGKCTGANLTPGTGGSRYLSLTVKLESNNELYCLDVK
jgi:flagellar basal body-associated protein FliL